MNTQKFKEWDKTIETELARLHISQSDFDKTANIVSDFAQKHQQLKEDNRSVFYILLLTAVYKAGRESVTALWAIQ